MIIRVERDGRVRAVYTDRVSLAGLGAVSIERASHVEHDDERQGWTVTFPDGSALPGAYPTRREALAAEVVEVERRMRGGS